MDIPQHIKETMDSDDAIANALDNLIIEGRLTVKNSQGTGLIKFIKGNDVLEAYKTPFIFGVLKLEDNPGMINVYPSMEFPDHPEEKRKERIITFLKIFPGATLQDFEKLEQRKPIDGNKI